MDPSSSSSSSSSPLSSLPSFLSAPVGFGVVTCAVHGSSYVLANLDKHLAKQHHLNPAARQAIRSALTAAGHHICQSVQDVQLPADHVAPLPGLPVYRAWKCARGCTDRHRISVNERRMKEHGRTVHGVRLGSRLGSGKGARLAASDKNGPHSHYSPVQVQTLFRETKDVRYFIVAVPMTDERDERSNAEASQQLLSEAQPAGSSQVSPTAGAGAAAELQRGYDEAQQDHLKRYELVGGIQHVSELMGWQRSTRFQAHLEGLDVSELPASYRIPKGDEAPVLRAVCDSVARILRSGMKELDYEDSEEWGKVSRIDTKLINTFEHGRMAKDPIKPLQNGKSRQNYISVFQKLFCYIWNITEESYLSGKRMFIMTAGQVKGWSNLRSCAADLTNNPRIQISENNTKSVKQQHTALQLDGQGREEQDDTAGGRKNSDDDSMEYLLDEAVLLFCVELLQQSLGKREFNSAIISFAAVVAWEPDFKAWMRIGDYTSYLSILVYCCQLVAIRYCIAATEEDDSDDGAFTRLYVRFRDQWLLNDSGSPMSTLLHFRLLGAEIARNTVESTEIRWEANGERIIYKNVELHMQQLRRFIQHEFTAAVGAFERDLCLGLRDIPRYAVANIVDNWQMRQPGASFLTDVRNASTFSGGATWLFDHVRAVSRLSDLFLRRSLSGVWSVDATAVRRYEEAVQQFLEHLMVLMHIGSGQPGRKKEFLGLRWCNRQSEPRNLYIHDGYAIFILSYNKSLNITNAAKFPVRVLLPRVAELLVRYLVLILPFRRWLLSRSKGSDTVSEYLWADGSGELWTEERMTKILASRSALAIGVRLTVKAWRQIAIGIAIEKFTGTKFQVEPTGDGASEGGGGEEDGGGGGGGSGGGDSSSGEAGRRGRGAMPNVFHFQAAHAPRTGNSAYGGSVDYKHGLTPAALQDFIFASRIWHDFVWQPGATSADSLHYGGGRHKRGASTGLVGEPLASRIAMRGARPQCRRNWTMREAREALQQMYGPHAEYRTAKQEEAVQAVVGGLTPVIAILGTGEGKSLLYMLPQRLPGAGITVLLVPLVALKADTIRKCRAMGIEVVVWGEDSAAGLERGLVVASLDQAVGERSSTFQAYLHGWKAAGQLSTIVVDECHLILTASSYRESMVQVKDLRVLGVQFVLLSATLPVYMVRPLCEALLLSSPVIIRGRTVRMDVQYEVEQARTPDLIAEAVGRLSKALRSQLFRDEEAARAIVYCRTRQGARAVAEALGCSSYCADSGTEEEKAEILAGWVRGDARVMAATSAFVEGIDYPCVRMVFHIDTPDTAVEFAQGVGRAGRDRGYGLSYVLLPKGWKAVTREASGELLDSNRRAMQQFLDYPRCRLLALGVFLDGKATFCSEGTTVCDRCNTLGLVAEAEEQWQEVRRHGESGGREGNEGELQGGEEDSEGERRAREAVMAEERRRLALLAMLEMVQGMCMVCLAEGKREGRAHGLEECTSSRKQRFFRAKKRANDEGREKGRTGWMAAYSGCFRCGLSQGLCEQRGQSGCRYRDVVMPLAWGAVLDGGRWSEVVRGLRGEGIGQERGYMEWLGEGRPMFGERSSNLVAVAEQMLKVIIERLKEE